MSSLNALFNPGLYSSILDPKYRFNIPLRAVVGSLPTQMSFGLNHADVVVMYPIELTLVSDQINLTHVQDATIKRATPNISMNNRITIPIGARVEFKTKIRIWYVANKDHLEIFPNHKSLIRFYPQYKSVVY